MKLYIYLLLFCAQYPTYAQKYSYIPIKADNGRALFQVDSLSFLEKYLTSEYYVDSITHEPYTGNAVVFYGNNAVDSLTLFQGIKNGWQRLYFKEKMDYILGQVEFYDQLNYAFVSHMSENENKSNHSSSSFARYLSNKKYYFFEVVYKANGKIIVNQSVQENIQSKYLVKTKFKINSLDELESFFSKYKPIYFYCKQADFW